MIATKPVPTVSDEMFKLMTSAGFTHITGLTETRRCNKNHKVIGAQIDPADLGTIGSNASRHTVFWVVYTRDGQVWMTLDQTHNFIMRAMRIISELGLTMKSSYPWPFSEDGDISSVDLLRRQSDPNWLPGV